MNDIEVIDFLQNKLGFSPISIRNLKKFHNYLLDFNKRYNLISKGSEKDIWNRHILDSAQLVSYIDQSSDKIADLGTGAGFPGLILAIYNVKNKFHVKLYEKSPVKRQFLIKMREELNIDFELNNNVYDAELDANMIVARAFKKLKEIISISREKIKIPHKMLILKGKSAQSEINKVSLKANYSYKLIDSITDKESKILMFNVK